MKKEENNKKRFDSKSKLHPRNKHRNPYDFDSLSQKCSELKPFIISNKFGNSSIDFSDPQAVKMLNRSILMKHYAIEFWEIPENYLCPPIPGRADYLHYMADLLAESNNTRIPTGKSIKCLDIGVGANCVYPIIGLNEYGWNFIGSESDERAMENAKKIVSLNPALKDSVEIRYQKSKQHFFEGVWKNNEKITITICNPPFHASAKEARKAAARKVSNLRKKKVRKVRLNFGGQSSELWCEGGELAFVKGLVAESRQYGESCLWFSSLVSQRDNLPGIYQALKKAKSSNVVTIDMGQGNKISRIVAWSFLSKMQRSDDLKDQQGGS